MDATTRNLIGFLFEIVFGWLGLCFLWLLVFVASIAIDSCFNCVNERFWRRLMKIADFLTFYSQRKKK